ncbi:CDP-diacylglycerol--glycerol-3-phosphate 3-phosphatidyltransferase [Aestuariimicrobium ganziense]|uniref:CDP-diacylglycerol--glycerol-3-phosphate 3-phosphatidyltransferase n=1 Tax=Aestuariimicrobium ganziense TaxID=2773677 RepID=UPI0019459D3D|nr:CDP-diacylglycerol--glycerol-3-phosphate 3-phosphatidyltransferase [Aestuariimicrobium ganziense]
MRLPGTNTTSEWNLPNFLTAVRMVAVPIFAWMLLAHPHDMGWRVATTVVFILASLTDMADGKIARKYGLVTNFGKLWDPIADKALTGMAFVALSILGELQWWVTIIILVREWGITLLRFAILKYGVMAANRGGKAKTLMQSVALVLYLLWLPHLPPVVQWAGWIAMAIAFALTVLTGLDYLREAWKLRRAAHQRCSEGRGDR